MALAAAGAGAGDLAAAAGAAAGAEAGAAGEGEGEGAGAGALAIDRAARSSHQVAIARRKTGKEERGKREGAAGAAKRHGQTGPNVTKR